MTASASVYQASLAGLYSSTATRNKMVAVLTVKEERQDACVLGMAPEEKMFLKTTVKAI